MSGRDFRSVCVSLPVSFNRSIDWWVLACVTNKKRENDRQIVVSSIADDQLDCCAFLIPDEESAERESYWESHSTFTPITARHGMRSIVGGCSASYEWR